MRETERDGWIEVEVKSLTIVAVLALADLPAKLGG